MARRIASLGPKPSLFFGVCFFVVSFLFFLFGWFEGQVGWPEGPPHLALNPPFFVIYFCSLLCLEKRLFSS